jgi:hypothetical protein
VSELIGWVVVAIPFLLAIVLVLWSGFVDRSR